MPIAVSDVTARARIRLSDVVGEQWDDDALLPFVQDAYEEAARFLRSKGMNLFRKESGTIAVAAGTKTITRTGGTSYPSDLLRPIEVRWRTAGATYWDQPPLRLNDGFFADGAPGTALTLYDWRNDTIYLGVGASVNTEVQTQYEAELPVVSAPTDTILIPNSLGPIALLVASAAADSRDEVEHADRWDKLAHAQLDYVAMAEQAARRAVPARFQGQ